MVHRYASILTRPPSSPEACNRSNSSVDRNRERVLRYQRVKSLETAQIHDITLRIQKLFYEIVPDDSLLPAAIDIASSHNHKIYDCLYLALALERGEPLATADRRMAQIAQSLSIETELIEPSL